MLRSYYSLIMCLIKYSYKITIRVSSLIEWSRENANIPINAMPIKNIATVTGRRMLNVLICKNNFQWF